MRNTTPGRTRSPFVIGAVALAAAALVACAPLPTRGLRASTAEIATAAQRPSPLPSAVGFASSNASPEQRTETVELIWKTIADRYYDPAYNGIDVSVLRRRSLAESEPVDSDAAFYRVLKRNVRAMKDSHTLILTPREAEDARTRRTTQIGLTFNLVEGRVVIASVVPGFPADQAGIREGMIVESIDGIALDDAFFARAVTSPGDPAGSEPMSTTPSDTDRSLRLRAVRSLLVAAIGEPVAHRMRLLRADDSRIDVTLLARAGELPRRVTYRRLDSGIGVLRLTRFDWSLRGDLAAAMREARDTRGLVVDLRGNPGGEQRLFTWLVGRFVERPVAVVELIQRSGARTTRRPLMAEPGEPAYRQPIAVLIDRGTGSASELLAHALVEQRAAIAVGEPTCGCVVAIRTDYVLPDGGALRVSETGYQTAGGRRMEADPLIPAIPVTPTLAERRAGTDAALRAAEAALAGRRVS